MRASLSTDRRSLGRLLGLAAAVACSGIVISSPRPSYGQATSAWVYYDHGALHYATDALGNRIIDYSSAGYGGGGGAPPPLPPRRTLSPPGGGGTAAGPQTTHGAFALRPPPER